MINPGDCFQFLSPHGELRLVLLVLESDQLEAHDRHDRARAWVLVLDATELAGEFRAGVGETTSWLFDARLLELGQLRRVS